MHDLTTQRRPHNVGRMQGCSCPMLKYGPTQTVTAPEWAEA